PITRTSRPTPAEKNDVSTPMLVIARAKTPIRYSALPGALTHHGPYVAQKPSAGRFCGGATAASVVEVVIGSSRCCAKFGLLARLDDQELSHHALVLVPQQMAVVHVRRGRVGVVLEPDEES